MKPQFWKDLYDWVRKRKYLCQAPSPPQLIDSYLKVEKRSELEIEIFQIYLSLNTREDTICTLSFIRNT